MLMTQDRLKPPTAQRSRWYDAALGRFISADSLVPGAGNPQALNRYAYVNNNSINSIDPSGNIAVDCDGFVCTPERDLGIDVGLSDDDDEDNSCVSLECDRRDAEATYEELRRLLRREPTEADILKYTAFGEYFSYVDDPTFPSSANMRAVAREALARNYYNACGKDGCSFEEMISFMMGYSPWFDDANVIDGDPAQRAQELYDGFETLVTATHLLNDVSMILNKDEAQGRGWTTGWEEDRPWQWYFRQSCKVAA